MLPRRQNPQCIIHGRKAPPNWPSPHCQHRTDHRSLRTSSTHHSRWPMLTPTPPPTFITTTLYLYATSKKPVRPHKPSRVSRNSTLQCAARGTVGAMPLLTWDLPCALTIDEPEKRRWNGVTRWCVRLIPSFFSFSFSACLGLSLLPIYMHVCVILISLRSRPHRRRPISVICKWLSRGHSQVFLTKFAQIVLLSIQTRSMAHWGKHRPQQFFKHGLTSSNGPRIDV